MKRSEAAKYARWSAVAALLLAGLTATFYVERGWQRILERRKAPPSPPGNVERQSTSLTFSKVEGERTIFTVEASKSTEFRGENASLLEDVKITVFGKTGQRHDVLHTQSCRFSKEKGTISCAGSVQIDLLSAEEAARTQGHPEKAAAKALHVETKGVTFDRASGIAKTDQPVMFRFPNGNGEAIGVEYKSEEVTLRLDRDVHFQLKPTALEQRETRVPQEVSVRGGQLDFNRDSRSLALRGPASAETPEGKITAGEFEMLLDEDFRAKTLLAKPAGSGQRPEAVLRGEAGDQSLIADLITAAFAPEGWLERVSATGKVQGTSTGRDDAAVWKAEIVELEMQPGLNEPKELVLRGGVSLKTNDAQSAETRELETEVLRMEFRPGSKGAQVTAERAETLAPGSVEWQEEASPEGPRRTKLSADRLALTFGEQGKARRLDAIGNVQTERQAAGKIAQTASAKTGTAELIPGGGWSQIRMDGSVQLKEGDRTATADRAVFVRAEQTATLTGHAIVKDAATQTTAPKLTFSQKTGDVTAEGGVQSADLDAGKSSVNLASGPVNITAGKLLANAKSGLATYYGHARLWQGESVLEADSIELSRKAQTLTANNGVKAVFPQSVKTAVGSENTRTAPRATALWNVSCEKMTYWDKESRAHLEKNVVIQSTGSRIRAGMADLYFNRGRSDARSGAESASDAQQISRAVATGGVIVEQGQRRATSDRAEYSAADGKFVMSGGNPTIFDANSGTTTGRQLTFFLANDTIIVDSENGSRTLTKHRVE